AQMIYLLILLFSLFHYGGAQQTSNYLMVPLAVRSPYLHCWGYLSFDIGFGAVPETNGYAVENHSDWDPILDARYFLARPNPNTDCTLEV
ncbi:hypothetical protein BJY52DRAFT_1309776, partial [Lactarius psammicola]